MPDAFSLRGPLAERYRIEEEIGRGGMATVYRALDLRHERRVAIKVLADDLALAVGGRFLQEIQVVARLSHPNILALLDSGESGGLPCYVMPYVAGESLRARLEREGPLPLDEAIQIACEMADALAYAHAQGVVHRDIKPDNVLFVAGHAVVSDFGIARAVDRAVESRLTGTGLTLGTPDYMSPEQATGGQVDGRSDIYSLGCVLYEMLTGSVPFPAATAAATIGRRLAETPPSVRVTRELVPVRIDEIVRRCMARSPADRFRTAEEVVRDLRVSVTGPVEALRSPRRGRLVLGALAAVAAVVAALLVVRGGPGETAAGDGDRLVVFPFTIHGDTDLAYLGEGMVDLLARNLDGLDGLHTVDAATVVTAVAAREGAHLDEEGRDAVSAALGAGAYVLGSVTAVGSELRLQARWHRRGATLDVGELVTVEGDTSDVLGLVDRLAARILISRGGEAVRLDETAALTTRSLPALRAYLVAEQTLRLGPQLVDSAIAGFRRAVELDSTFALAYYRLAVSSDWQGRRGQAALASREAIVHAGRLGDRDRRLLEAYAAYRGGHADEAEEAYRALLRDYPDDLEAQFQLADLMVIYNPLRGRALREPRDIFDTVLEADPGFL